MIQKFLTYIKKENLFQAKHKLLVAVSGGNDSMALCELLKEAGFSFSVAHCNFTLRGAESDADATFVEGYCLKNKIKFFYHSFDTASYAAKHKISTQMAARELRYTWFEELVKKNKFDYLLTAHHLNDNMETFFINLLRGSGINGLKGIVPKSGKKVRPLLFATRDEIEDYVRQKGILYREDSSNMEDKYLRNRLRHHLIPELKSLNPSFEQTFASEIEILQQVNELVFAEVEKKKKTLVQDKKGFRKIDIEKLKRSGSPKLFLYELLKDFGFNSAQSAGIYDGLDGLTGKIFFSETHQLVKDRKHLLVRDKTEVEETEISIYKKTDKVKQPVQLEISYYKIKKGEEVKIPALKNVAYMDADKLKFPMKITRWQTGDRFVPLGMWQSKKLSDFFVGEKMSLFEKDNQWILRNKDAVVWVMGRRIDDRFKITPSTKNVCIIELKEQA
ncbi:MAG TPA: tRNA lysidine(34) synthetase TilS [Bacteroidia bacterium]|jgi:tRNA(Ile)-lysidine synthase|nr:tRNA lysidine(34) synthetase TilS [Bacteroidia bacterium]